MSDSTKTNIANLSLRELGATRIEDFEEVSATADIVRDVWSQGVRKALSRHEWEFATKAKQLTQETSTIGGYAYKYADPTDFIRLSAVYDDENMDAALWDRAFKHRGGFIETDCSKCFIEYVYHHTTVGAWPPWFIDVLVADLAGVLASPLKSSTERERLDDMAVQRLRDGKSVDSAQKATIMLPQSRWITGMKGGNIGRRSGGWP